MAFHDKTSAAAGYCKQSSFFTIPMYPVGIRNIFFIGLFAFIGVAEDTEAAFCFLKINDLRC